MAVEEKPSGQLGLWDAISIIIGIVIGTVIFELPGIPFFFTPNPWMSMGVWVFGGFLAFVGGLCYAELATTYPKDGGDYYYLTEGFGRWVGFLFGWAQLILILPSSIGVMAYVFANHMHDIHPFPEVPDYFELKLNSQFYYAVAAILALTFLNLIGVTLGKIAQNILAFVKVAGLLAIIGTAFYVGGIDNTEWTLPSTINQWGWQAPAIIVVLYAFGGWNDAAWVAAEVRNPQKNIPWALLGGIGGITAIYLLVNFSYILALGFSGVHSAEKGGPVFGIPETLVAKAWGEHAGKALSVIIMLSALGAVNGLTFAGSRVYATLGSDHRLFGFVGGWRPGSGSPIAAMMLQALITVGLLFLVGTEKGHNLVNDGLDAFNEQATQIASSFNENWTITIEYGRDWQPRKALSELVDHSAPAFWLFFMLAGFSLFTLREKNPNLVRPFSVPLYPIVPFIFCNSCVFMLYSSVTWIGWRTLFVVALLLIGIPLYGLSELFGRPEKPEDSTPTLKLPPRTGGNRFDIKPNPR